MMKKKEIIDLCKQIATDYPGWVFAAEMFKNKSEKHSTKLVIPLWSFSPGSALAQPNAGFVHGKIDRIYREIFGFESLATSWVRHEDIFEKYKWVDLRFYDIVKDKAEEKIRLFFEEGIKIIDDHYDFSSEKNLLENMPADIEQQEGVSYCLVRAYLGDYDFVRRYRADEIETEYDKYHDHIDKIIKYFDIK